MTQIQENIQEIKPPETTLQEQAKQKRHPDFKGDGVAVWINYDKNNNQYLSISILGNLKINVFKYQPVKTQ